MHEENSVNNPSEIGIFLIFVSTFITMFGVSLLSPAFPKIIDYFQISEQSVGLIASLFILPGIFLALFIGGLADKYGRKPILVFSLILYGLAGGIAAFSPTYRILLTLRIIQGIGAAGLLTSIITLIGDLYSGNKRAHMMGLNVTVLGLGTALSPLIGGILAEISWTTPFLLFFTAIIVGLLVQKFLKEPKTNKNNTNIKKYSKQVIELFKHKNTLIGMTFGILSFSFLFGGVITYLPILLDTKFSTSSTIIGALTSIEALTLAIVSSQAGKIVSRINIMKIMKISFIFYGTSLILTPMINKLILITIPMTIFGLGHGLLTPNLQTYMSELTSHELRGALASIYNISIRTGCTIGPIIFSLIVSITGIKNTYQYIGIIALLIFAISILIPKILSKTKTPITE